MMREIIKVIDNEIERFRRPKKSNRTYFLFLMYFIMFDIWLLLLEDLHLSVLFLLMLLTLMMMML